MEGDVTAVATNLGSEFVVWVEQGGEANDCVRAACVTGVDGDEDWVFVGKPSKEAPKCVNFGDWGMLSDESGLKLFKKFESEEVSCNGWGCDDWFCDCGVKGWERGVKGCGVGGCCNFGVRGCCNCGVRGCCNCGVRGCCNCGVRGCCNCGVRGCCNCGVSGGCICGVVGCCNCDSCGGVCLGAEFCDICGEGLGFNCIWFWLKFMFCNSEPTDVGNEDGNLFGFDFASKFIEVCWRFCWTLYRDPKLLFPWTCCWFCCCCCCWWEYGDGPLRAGGASSSTGIFLYGPACWYCWFVIFCILIAELVSVL